MRKFISRIAILAVCSFGFIGIASAAPASAANCTDTGSGNTYYVSGKLHFDFHVLQCSGVDQIQVEVLWPNGTCGPGGSYCSGWFDSTSNTMVKPDQPWSRLWGRIGVPIGPGIIDNYAHNPWCAGGVHVVHRQFNFRIHNITYGTWGSWYTNISGGEAIVC